MSPRQAPTATDSDRQKPQKLAHLRARLSVVTGVFWKAFPHSSRTIEARSCLPVERPSARLVLNRHRCPVRRAGLYEGDALGLDGDGSPPAGGRRRPPRDRARLPRHSLQAEATGAEEPSHVVGMVDDVKASANEIDDLPARPQARVVARRLRARPDQTHQAAPPGGGQLRGPTRRRPPSGSLATFRRYARFQRRTDRPPP